MTFWAYVWNRLKAVPAGVWAALAVAGALLKLYLDGKRLQAELTKAKFDAGIAQAAAITASNTGAAVAHIESAEAHAQKAADLVNTLSEIQKSGQSELKRLHTLPPAKVTKEYLELLRQQEPS